MCLICSEDRHHPVCHNCYNTINRWERLGTDHLDAMETQTKVKIRRIHVARVGYQQFKEQIEKKSPT